MYTSVKNRVFSHDMRRAGIVVGVGRVCYEVRSETKLVFRVVEPLFRFASLSTEFVASTSQVVSARIAPIRLSRRLPRSSRRPSVRLVAAEFVSSTPQIESSFFCSTRGCRVRLVDSPDRVVVLLFDSWLPSSTRRPPRSTRREIGTARDWV